MHRIDGYGATVDNLFTEGDPAGAIPATDVTDDWLNATQEELCTVVEASGQTLDKEDNSQLLNAIVLSPDGLAMVASIASLRGMGTPRNAKALGYYTPGDGGGGMLYWQSGEAPGTYIDDGGSVIVPTSGDGSAAWVAEFNGILNIRRFGAHPSQADTVNTASIQNVINFASNSEFFEVFGPAGHYLFTRLYFYYDAVNNPGYNQTARHGRVRVRGAGKLDISNLRTYSPAYGTVLESTVSTANCLIVASQTLGHDISPYPARQFVLDDITLVGNTTGFVVEAAACPEFCIINAAVLQQHADGSGVDLRSAWYANIQRSTIMQNASLPTGVGVRCGSDTSAGLFKISDESLIDGFQDNITWESGSWQGFKISDSAIQGHTRYGFSLKGGTIGMLSLENAHFESDGRVSDIHGEIGTINNLVLNHTYFNCGSTTESYLTGPVIDIENVEVVDIACNTCFRLFTSFCNIDNVENGTSLGKASNNIFKHDNPGAVSGPVYLFVGKVPDMVDNTYTSQGDGLYASAIYRLFDPDSAKTSRISSKFSGFNIFSKIGFGPVIVELGASGVYYIASNGNNNIYDITNTVSSSVAVSNIDEHAGEGRFHFVANNAASVDIINVRNLSDSSIIVVLSPGEWCLLFYNRATGKFNGYK